MLDQYAAAFENADTTTLMRLLTRDAIFEMPPFPTWFTGRDDIGRFLATRLCRPGLFRAVPTMANDQPTFALYARDPTGTYVPHAVQVLRVTADGVSHIATFHDADLFPAFGLPPTVSAAE